MIDRKEYMKQYRLENKDKLKEQQKQYHLDNKEKRNKQSVLYNIENKDKIQQYQKQYGKLWRKENGKQYYLDNKDRILEQTKLSHLKHKDSISKRKKRYCLDNKDKVREWTRQWRLNNVDRIRNCDLVRQYGITIEQFNNMKEQQGNQCAICPDIFKDKKNVCVDHDHNTGKVRGVLCRTCNTSLGDVRDDINLIKKLIGYLGMNINNGIYTTPYRLRNKKQEMLVEQNNSCFVCDTVFKSSKNAHIDHNHKTGNIRQLLCKDCNLALGHFKEDIIVMQNAIDYLTKYAEPISGGGINA